MVWKFRGAKGWFETTPRRYGLTGETMKVAKPMILGFPLQGIMIGTTLGTVVLLKKRWNAVFS